MINNPSLRCMLAPLLLLHLAMAATLGSADVTAAESNPRVQELQEGLAELGYDPGPADGLLGPKTREAITAFQKDHDLIVDGKYSGILLFRVNVERSIAQEKATPEGRARKAERMRLLALSDADLASLIKKTDRDEAQKILNLIGERAKDLPLYVLMNKLGMGEAVEYMVPLLLKGLYYPGTKEGIRQFQHDIGESETGELSFGQFSEIQRRWTRIRDTPVYAGGSGETKIFVLDGYASVEGTWILEGEQIAYPINKAKITCNRESRACTLIQAEVVVPTIDQNDDSYFLNVHSDTYSIITWDTGEIVARDAGECRTTLLTLNMNSDEVYEVTRNNETKACREGYLTLPSLDKPRIARLVPGWDVTYDFWQRRQEKTSKYFNPRIRKAMEAAFKELQPAE